MTPQPSRLTEELQQFVSEKELSRQDGELDLRLREAAAPEETTPEKPRLVPPSRSAMDPRFLRTLDIVLMITAAGVGLLWAAVLLSR
ncbi:MAG: hypothetical protein LC804_25860 [Acidobacteria bacterium]|nr:hypothetical protein [Acidobacteriota bacterium]